MTRELTFYSQVEDPCTAAVSSAVLLENSPLSDDMEQVDRLGNVASFQVAYQIDPSDLANTDAGLWQADIAAQGTTEDHATASFRLLRACPADDQRRARSRSGRAGRSPSRGC